MLAPVIQAAWHLVAILARGGLVMILLLGASLITLAVMLERWRFWRGMSTQKDGTHVLALVAAGNASQALQMARDSHHPVARVLLGRS